MTDTARLLERALRPVRQDLHAVSERMRSHLSDPVARKVVYLIAAGGKRLRPALVLLAGSIGSDPDGAGLIEAATAVEMIHTATLIHDDIIDQSPLRRSRPTFHHRWGTERAVLMGDYLYAQAFRLLSRLRTPRVMQIMAEVCEQLCRGELREVEARYRLDLTEAEYFAIIRDKTASLIGGCCHSGAVLGGCEPEVVMRLTRFGAAFGLGFQVMDDCLDMTGSPSQLGKTTLSDLDKGIFSLPIIYLTQRLSAPERRRLFAPLRKVRGRMSPLGSRRRVPSLGASTVDPAFLRRVAAAAKESGALAQAYERARGLIQESQACLDGVPLNGMGQVYHVLTQYAMARRS
jgi:heptaprenyl diphosphate synthase